MDDNGFAVLTAAAMRVISQKIEFFHIYVNFRISAVERESFSELMQGCISVATFIHVLLKFRGYSLVKLRCKQYVLVVRQTANPFLARVFYITLSSVIFLNQFEFWVVFWKN
jgi:hypothetical protein